MVSDKRILSILPYVKGTTDRIGQISELSLNHQKDRIKKILRKPEGQRPPFSSAGIYKIFYFCGQVYIGETGRMINLRIKKPT